MKLNKTLKIEGMIISILITLSIIGLILWHTRLFYHSDFLTVLAIFGSATILHVIIIGGFFYWLWRLYKYQKS